MSKRRFPLGPALAIASLVMLVFVSGCLNGDDKGGPVLEKVTVGYLPMVSSLTHFVALDKGIYKKHGLEVTATRIATSNLLASQVIEGKLDAAIELSLVPLLQADNGDDEPSYKIFSASNITKADSFDGIVVSKNSAIKTIADLSGKKVAVFPGTTAKASLEHYFSLVAPGRALPVCKPTAPDLQLQALESGSVDALHCYEPILARALVGSNARLLPDSGVYAQLQENSPVGVGAVNARFAQARASACEKLIASLDEAAAYVRDNPEDARRILSRLEGLEEPIALSVHDLNMGTSAEVSLQSLQEFERLMIRLGEIKGPIVSENHIHRNANGRD